MAAQRKRGPSYPAYGLTEAVNRARQLLDTHGKRHITADEAVQTWGYSGLSGPAARALAGLRHYGLVEGANEALRLSSDAIAILADDGSPDVVRSLSRAAERPKVYQEILGAFPVGGGLPSDGAIRAYLLKHSEFSQSAIEEIVEAFTDTVALAKLYANPDNSEAMNRETTSAVASETRGFPVPSARRDVGAMSGAASTGAVPLTIPLLGGGMAILSVNLPLTEENFEMIKRTLETMRPAITAAKEPKAQNDTDRD